MLRTLKIISPHLILLLCLCLLLGAAGCATHVDSDGSDSTLAPHSGEIQPDSWWRLYQQGESLAAAGSDHKALSLFQKAIELRAEDAWRAEIDRTHFLAYFPHRELGIVYFQRREYDKAISELEESLAHEQSARAGYFLNKARAARISRHGSDRKPPVLVLEGSSAGEITGGLTWTVRGVASDDTYVASITVNGRPVPLEAAERKKVFSTEVSLAKGNNSIRVEAVDLSGKSTEKTLSVYADRQGPQIELEEVTHADNLTSFRGNVSDDNGVATLRINGERWPVTGNAPGYNFKLTLPEGDISVLTADRAGNVTRALIPGSQPDLPAMKPMASPPAVPTDLLGATEMPAADKNMAAAPESPRGSADLTGPSIRLDDIGPDQDTFEETVLLRGSVSADSLLVYLTVNGQEIVNRRGRTLYFARREKLREGKNVFHILAADEYGNTTEKTVAVNRKIPNIRRIEARMSMAVVPFAGPEAALSGEKSIFSELLSEAFRKQARFNIMTQEIINQARLKLQSGTAPITDPGRAADLGRAVGAQTVLAGVIIERPDGVEIAGYLVDSETGLIIASNDLYANKDETVSPAKLATLLADKFKRDFPLLTGSLLAVNDTGIRIDLGTGTGINPHSRLICYRDIPSLRHPVTGRLLESEPRILGRLKVEEVFKDSARARILSRDAEFVATDSVIVQ